MFECRDQLDRTVVLQKYPPGRIVSLVPSQTELLADLGLEKEVVGITKFCVHPQDWFQNKTRVGGTKQINIEQVRSLQPDLLLANKEENVREQIDALEHIAPVWITDVKNYEEALQMIKSIGELTDKRSEAKKLITQIDAGFSQLTKQLREEGRNDRQLTACYLIWRNPYMTVGGDTFISDMIKKAGFINIFEKEIRYPEISLQQLASFNPQVILLSSEPYPFKERHIEEIRRHLTTTKILLVDGEMFSWYGSRMKYAASYFQELSTSTGHLMHQ